MGDAETVGATATQPSDRAVRGRPSAVRHGAGFVASGLIALAVDGGVTSGLTRALDVPALMARPVGIALAIVVAWACHRRLTFAMTTPPSFAEFGRYAAVAAGAASVNYVIFAAILALVPHTAPEVALLASSIASMVVSYVGMRLGVFRPAD